MAMNTTYTNLCVISLCPQRHAQTCGYWYLVQARGMPHTAFAEEAHLLDWLAARGLALTQPLPSKGVHSYQQLSGTYTSQSHMSYDAFFALKGLRVRVLDNARYTLGIVTEDDEGHRTVHYLNCNCHDRPEFDYAESRALCG